MVQEFHVLRCFSCQTFQVQQVKKTIKWNCKMCGEKQSVIKEYGRGAAADCRRHVQKLNSLRGELLEVNKDKVLSQWEQDKDYQKASDYEHLETHNKSEQEVPSVSCWSKYIDQPAEDPKQEEDEKEDENMYMERDKFRIQRPRKRNLVSNFKSVDAIRGNLEHEKSWTNCPGVKSCSYQQPTQHDGTLSSQWNKGFFSKYSNNDNAKDILSPSKHVPSASQTVLGHHTASTSYKYTVVNSIKCQSSSSHTEPGDEVHITKHLPVTNKGISTTSSSQTFESILVNKDSKWNKFLTVVPTQEEDNGVDDHLSVHVNKVVSEVSVGETETEGQMSADVGMDGHLSNQLNSHTFNSKHAVCKPPLPKRLCPGLSINSMFFTEEDFDDSF